MGTQHELALLTKHGFTMLICDSKVANPSSSHVFACTFCPSSLTFSFLPCTFAIHDEFAVQEEAEQVRDLKDGLAKPALKARRAEKELKFDTK